MMATVLLPFGPQSARLTCPNCRAEIFTRTKSEASTKAWVAGLIIALFGCVFGCCLIPCLMDDCKNVHHTCPNCNVYLGKFER